MRKELSSALGFLFVLVILVVVPFCWGGSAEPTVVPLDPRTKAESRTEALESSPERRSATTEGPDGERVAVEHGGTRRWRCAVVDATLECPIPRFYSATAGVSLLPLGTSGNAIGESLPGARFDLVAPGYRKICALAPIGDELVVFRLESDSEPVTVSVVLDSGSPLAGAQVWARTQTSSASLLGSTDSDGKLVASLPRATELMAQADMGMASAWHPREWGSNSAVLRLQRSSSIRFRDHQTGLEVADAAVLLTSATQKCWISSALKAVPCGLYTVRIDPEGRYALVGADGNSAGMILDRPLRLDQEWIDVALDAGILVSVVDAVSNRPIKKVWIACFLSRPSGDLPFPPASLHSSADGVFVATRHEHMSTTGAPSHIKLWAAGYEMATLRSPSRGLNRVALQPSSSSGGSLRIRSQSGLPIERLKLSGLDRPLLDLRWQDPSEAIDIQSVDGYVGVSCNLGKTVAVPVDHVSDSVRHRWVAQVDLDSIMGRIVVAGISPEVAGGLECAIGGDFLQGMYVGGDLVFPYVPPGRASVCVANVSQAPSAAPWWSGVEVIAGETVRLDGSQLQPFGPAHGHVEIQGQVDTENLWISPVWGTGGLMRFSPEYAAAIRQDGSFRLGSLPAKPSFLVLFQGPRLSRKVPVLAIDAAVLQAAVAFRDIEVDVIGVAADEKVVIEAKPELSVSGWWFDGLTTSRTGPGIVVMPSVPTSVSAIVQTQHGRVAGRWSIPSTAGHLVTMRVRCIPMPRVR